MSDIQTEEATAGGTSASELEFRRYEARLGVWKVVLGTLIVGLAGVLIPGAISFYGAFFENQRKQTELVLSQQTAHQQYIKDFFATAINQDIELRIRFAEYFANLSGPGQEELWQGYLTSLKQLRDGNRVKINDLERLLVNFKKLPPDQIDNAEFDRINRELAWANAEIGYVPTERSAVMTVADGSLAARKLKLYQETTDLVQRMVSRSTPLMEFPDDLARFWDLYRKDLIGVESREFAQTMIAIGKVLQKLVAVNLPPDEELKQLSESLLVVSRKELAGIAQAREQLLLQQQIQQQQQQQQQPQQQQQQQQQLMQAQ